MVDWVAGAQVLPLRVVRGIVGAVDDVLGRGGVAGVCGLCGERWKKHMASSSTVFRAHLQLNWPGWECPPPASLLVRLSSSQSKSASNERGNDGDGPQLTHFQTQIFWSPTICRPMYPFLDRATDAATPSSFSFRGNTPRRNHPIYFDRFPLTTSFLHTLPPLLWAHFSSPGGARTRS